MPQDKADITDAGPRLKAMNDALEEIDRLRKREAELLAAGDRLESQLCEAARERDRLRPTDAERYAVLSGLRSLERQLWSDRENLGGEYRDLQRDAARIRGFLQRVGGGE